MGWRRIETSGGLLCTLWDSVKFRELLGQLSYYQLRNEASAMLCAAQLAARPCRRLQWRTCPSQTVLTVCSLFLTRAHCVTLLSREGGTRGDEPSQWGGYGPLTYKRQLKPQ
jgi:hypothetical protein